MQEKKKLTKMQRAVLIPVLLVMAGVGVAGGIGTYTNLSSVYGGGTALGALAAGEGATAVLGLLMLGVTLLGQPVPQIIRAGLWVMPAAAAVMGATAAEGVGQTIVFALTPMAITASAEGIAFLARRIVVHQEGRDVEAEARAADAVRDLAYHQARASAHPSRPVRWISVRRSWQLARRVGTGDAVLADRLREVQRDRITAGADAALAAMYQPSASPLAALETGGEVSAESPALPAASAGELTSSPSHEPTIRPDAAGYPHDTTSDQGEEAESIRPDAQDVRPGLHVVPDTTGGRRSIRADVLGMVADGVADIRHVVDAVAARHGRSTDDKALRQTVTRYMREAREGAAREPEVGAYL